MSELKKKIHVDEIEQNSFGELNFFIGDEILDVNGKEVQNVEEVKRKIVESLQKYGSASCVVGRLELSIQKMLTIENELDSEISKDVTEIKMDLKDNGEFLQLCLFYYTFLENLILTCKNTDGSDGQRGTVFHVFYRVLLKSFLVQLCGDLYKEIIQIVLRNLQLTNNKIMELTFSVKEFFVTFIRLFQRTKSITIHDNGFCKKVKFVINDFENKELEMIMDHGEFTEYLIKTASAYSTKIKFESDKYQELVLKSISKNFFEKNVMIKNLILDENTVLCVEHLVMQEVQVILKFNGLEKVSFIKQLYMFIFICLGFV